MVRADSPVYTVVAATNDYLEAVDMRREEVVGQGYFELFAQTAELSADSDEENLKASFEYVRTQAKRHEVILNDGDHTRKLINTPVQGDDGH